MLVLDEADEMLNKGFKEQIYDVYRYLPPSTQVYTTDIYLLQLRYTLYRYLPPSTQVYTLQISSSFNSGIHYTGRNRKL